MTIPTPPCFDSILDVIGHTPMVELNRIVKTFDISGRLLTKLEYLNPGYSMKDRIALEMIRDAHDRGHLAPGQTVVELTSGNTGTGLAIVCRALGHPFIAVMSRGNTMERARQMAALGAEVILVDQAPGSLPNQVSGRDIELVEQNVQKIVHEQNAFRTNQFELQSNCNAHEKTTGPEIWQQSNGQVDAFLAFAGTAGTFTGVMRFLKKQNSQVRGYIVEPLSAPAISGQPVTNPSHKIQGGGYNLTDPPLLDRSLVTDYLQVTDDQAIDAARLLAREEGIFAGFSSGAHLAAAIELLKTSEKGNTIAFLICDSGLKYLSTDLYPNQSIHHGE